MAIIFNISDVVKSSEESPNGYADLTKESLLIVRERLGYIDDANGYAYAVSDGVRTYVLKASQMEMYIDITSVEG